MNENEKKHFEKVVQRDVWHGCRGGGVHVKM